jgi:hypothetical protein
MGRDHGRRRSCRNGSDRRNRLGWSRPVWTPARTSNLRAEVRLLPGPSSVHGDEYAEGVDSRQTKVFLPIDIPAIAAELGVDVNSVFGRLYFHLDPQYAEPEDAARNRPRKSFFTPRLGPDVEGETNCINFPFLEAVLAGLWQQRNRDRWTFWIAVVSLGIAIGSLLVSFFG